ncbi:1,4-alpha-glucan branching protein GlgB [Endozoicomonas sp. Mp262]|uniref:1,4-alpha-glucan branching protein GlgB n=1 Tax=Endozoicomonas sp. Mp262 TaxID=2919499 RepID=UPI0021D9F964
MNIAVTPHSSINELEQVLCACPFDFLGLHQNPSGKGLVARVWRPDARSVKLREYPSGKLLGEMASRIPGLFEFHLTRRRKLFNYQLDICTEDGHSYRILDPYQFGQYVLKQDDIDYDNLHRHLGAHKNTHHFNTRRTATGVLFRVYAPHARSVSVTGSFNNWDGRIHPMASADDGIWRLFVPGLKPGELYKYEIHDQQGNQLPLKADPFGEYAEQWPGLASIVYDRDRYQWKDTGWLEKRKDVQGYDKPISVYEVHAGSWKRKEEGEFLNYRELAKELVPYVRKMGFTHIELMPISEHPLYDSWGYQPVGMFAPTSRYGSPDDFKYFVDHCHQAGIGVILDWVPAHFPNDDHGLANFDGTALYEHPDPRRGWHPDWKTCIYDFGKPWVQDFLISNALYWLDEYHIDGLRVDAVASMLYLDYSRNYGEWEPNIHGGHENLEAIALLKRFNETVYRCHPDVMTIAEESTSWPGVSRPLYENGLGFGYKWNMGWMHDSLGFMKKAPEHRQHHHGQMTFSTVYAWSENFILSLSHDEVVYGKGTLLTRMPGDDWQKFANLRAYLAFMYTHPGKKLLFMGGELGTWHEWNHNGVLDWPLLEQHEGRHAGVQSLVKKLNKVYRDLPALHEQDVNPEGFYWLVDNDSAQSVLAYARVDKKGQSVVVISNLTPVVRTDYCIGVPDSGGYQEVLNTDWTEFSGSGVTTGKSLMTQPVSMHGQEQSLSLTLPPLATVILMPYQQYKK